MGQPGGLDTTTQEIAMSDDKSTTTEVTSDGKSTAGEPGASLAKLSALDYREEMAHRLGFQEGWKRACAILLERAAAQFLDGEDEAAIKARGSAESLLETLADAVVERYGETDGINYDACRDVLLDKGTRHD
jgi:hypothetical protein